MLTEALCNAYMVRHEGKVRFCHSEGWSLRNEALMSSVLRRAANSCHHRIIACDDHVDPSSFAAGDWVSTSKAKIEAPSQGSATYCAKGAGGVDIRNTLDHRVVSESLECSVKCIEVVEEFLASPHTCEMQSQVAKQRHAGQAA